jgi:PTH1 family peptidyl-tRNA hydrolase
MSEALKLIVGLGNPGKEYEFTRHNIGQLVLDHLQRDFAKDWKKKFRGDYCKVTEQRVNALFLKPQTYMNLSGRSVLDISHFFKIKQGDILVVHDELDLPFGVLALKKGGGLAGHNGLKSIAECLGGREFLRLRMGIGRPSHGPVSKFVLSHFSQTEQTILDDFLIGGCDAVRMFLRQGFENAASTYSRKDFKVNL